MIAASALSCQKPCATQIHAHARIQQQRRYFNHRKSRISRRKHGVAEVKQRLNQALRSAMSNDSDKPDQVTSLTFLIRSLRADLGPGGGIVHPGPAW